MGCHMWAHHFTWTWFDYTLHQERRRRRTVNCRGGGQILFFLDHPLLVVALDPSHCWNSTCCRDLLLLLLFLYSFFRRYYFFILSTNWKCKLCSSYLRTWLARESPPHAVKRFIFYVHLIWWPGSQMILLVAERKAYIYGGGAGVCAWALCLICLTEPWTYHLSVHGIYMSSYLFINSQNMMCADRCLINHSFLDLAGCSILPPSLNNCRIRFPRNNFN